jgi:hypothetical protein
MLRPGVAACDHAYMRWSTTPAATPAVSDVSAPALALDLQRQGADLRVSWNRHAFAVALATGGELVIREPPLPCPAKRPHQSRRLCSNSSKRFFPALRGSKLVWLDSFISFS